MKIHKEREITMIVERMQESIKQNEELLLQFPSETQLHTKLRGSYYFTGV